MRRTLPCGATLQLYGYGSDEHSLLTVVATESTVSGAFIVRERHPDSDRPKSIRIATYLRNLPMLIRTLEQWLTPKQRARREAALRKKYGMTPPRKVTRKR